MDAFNVTLLVVSGLLGLGGLGVAGFAVWRMADALKCQSRALAEIPVRRPLMVAERLPDGTAQLRPDMSVDSKPAGDDEHDPVAARIGAPNPPLAQPPRGMNPDEEELHEWH